MFKKLKQKISEEQTPPRGSGGRAAPNQHQVPPKSPPLTDKRSRSSSLAEQNDEGTLTPDKEIHVHRITEWPGLEGTSRITNLQPPATHRATNLHI